MNLPAGEPESSSARVGRRRALLGGLWAVYFCFGLTATAMAPLVGVIASDLGLSRTEMGSVLGAWPLVYIAAAMPAGAILDRFGFGRALFGAVLAIALSGALRSFAEGHLSLFLAVGVFGLGGPLVSIGGPKLITRHYAAQEHGLAIGIYTTGPVVGGIVALSLTNSLVMPAFDHDWRAVLQLYAGITLIVALSWLAIGGNEGGRDTTGQEKQDNSQLAVFARLLRLPVVKLTLLMGIAIFFFNHALNNWLPEILRAGGMDAVSAGHWAAIPTAVGIIGALTIPRLATGSRRRQVMVALAVSAGLATLLIPASGWILALGLIFQGVARGAMMAVALMVLMDAREIGPRLMGAAGGLFFTAAEIGGVLGPLTVGWLAERSGGFSAPLWMLFGVCAVLTALTLVATRNRP
ncbi:MAG TPA: MFS transporter [Gammaproteobacteria bacterium]|nr:MFS transporter [Gammaproteobacteria bacterium]